VSKQDTKNSTNLLLQGKNMCNTSINGVSDPCLSLIGNSDNRLITIGNRDMQQQLGNITSTKNLMNGCKPSSPLFRAKIRCKDTIGGTFPPEKLACSTRRTSASHRWCHDGRNRRKKQREEENLEIFLKAHEHTRKWCKKNEWG
jgi:hypothetical protein